MEPVTPSPPPPDPLTFARFRKEHLIVQCPVDYCPGVWFLELRLPFLFQQEGGASRKVGPLAASLE